MVKAREVERSTRRWSRDGSKSRTGTIDAPLGPRSPPADEARGEGGRIQECAHPLRGHRGIARPTRSSAARLETGRTHQIRVHFAAIQHSVAGDPEYGRARAARPRAAVPACESPGVHAIPAPGSRWSSPRSCRRTCVRRCVGPVARRRRGRLPPSAYNPPTFAPNPRREARDAARQGPGSRSRDGIRRSRGRLEPDPGENQSDWKVKWPR